MARDCEMVRKALAGVARAQRRGGMQAIAQMLVGDGSEKVKRFGFHNLSTFGILSGLSEREANDVLRATIAAGYVGLTSTEHPVPFLTTLGGKVMRSETENGIVLATRPKKAAARRAAGPRERVLDNARRRRLERTDDEGEARKDAKAAGRAAELSDTDASVVKRFDLLRAARAKLAKEANVPAYVVAHDRALMALAEHAPGDVDAMMAVPGWGPAKVAKWGEALLGAMAG